MRKKLQDNQQDDFDPINTEQQKQTQRNQRTIFREIILVTLEQVVTEVKNLNLKKAPILTQQAQKVQNDHKQILDENEAKQLEMTLNAKLLQIKQS